MWKGMVLVGNFVPSIPLAMAEREVVALSAEAKEVIRLLFMMI